MKRIKHNDLTHYFLRPHQELPRSYIDSCEKFFRELKNLKLARLTAENVQKKKKIKKTRQLGCKPTSFRTNPRILPGRKLRVQASSQRPQAPRSWNQGTSAQA